MTVSMALLKGKFVTRYKLNLDIQLEVAIPYKVRTRAALLAGTFVFTLQ